MNQGDAIENEHGSFTSDQEMQEFSSVDEMEKTIGIHFDLLDQISALSSYINVSKQGEEKLVHIQYKTHEKQITLKIYLENAPYYQESMEQANLQKQLLGNLEWYITTYDQYQTIVAFDNTFVYVITADSIDSIKTLMEGN